MVVRLLAPVYPRGKLAGKAGKLRRARGTSKNFLCHFISSELNRGWHQLPAICGEYHRYNSVAEFGSRGSVSLGSPGRFHTAT